MPGVCHRCKRNVYLAEEKIALGKVWHDFCVSCRKCRKLLDECSAKLYQDEIYCRKCYNALCGRCCDDDDDEERRCGGRRGGCCRRCPTPSRIPARAKPSPVAVTTWYSRGHSMQPCKGCPRCAAKEPWFVCEGGSQRCPRTRTSSCDESCPGRESLECVPCGSEEKICAAPKVVKETKPTPPCVYCACCGRELPRRRSCCRRCHRSEKSDDERECRPRRRSCDRATCCALRSRRRNCSPCSVPEPPCLPCPPSDEERESRCRRRRSCDRCTCCSCRSRRRTTSPCSTAAPPCIPCPPPPDPPCLPRPPCDPIPPCNSCPPYTSFPPCSRPKTPEPICVPCPASRPRTPEPPCRPCRRPEPPCRPCKPPEPPCIPCKPPEPPCRPCRRPKPPCRPCRTPEPPCSPCKPPEPPCRPCRTPEPPCTPCRPPEPPCRPCRTPEPPCRPCRPPEPPCRPCRPPEPPCRPCRPPEPPCIPCRPPEPPCRPCRPPEPPCRPCPATCQSEEVEVLCPPADCCRCTCCGRRRRGRSCTSSDRTSMVSSCSPCPTVRPRCCRNDLPIGRPCRRCGRQVYHAELVLAAGTVFHTCCYTCRQCRKPLETTTVYEAENEIFCKQCYVKRFGPIGYGYGLGAGTLQTP